jgi:hypothetical protein
LCPCRTGQRLRSMMATVGLTTRRTMAIGPVTRHMKAMTGSHRTMAIGLQTMELGPRTPRRICKVGPLTMTAWQLAPIMMMVLGTKV